MAILGQRRSIHTRVVKSTVVLVSTVSLHFEVPTHRPTGHVSSPGGSASATSPSPASSSSSAAVEMPASASVWASSHGLLPPVTPSITPSGLARGRAHHPGTASSRERGGVAVGRRWVGVVRAGGGIVGWIAAIHGHRHVHVHVHVHSGAVAKQACVHWSCPWRRARGWGLGLTLLQGAQQLLDLVREVGLLYQVLCRVAALCTHDGGQQLLHVDRGALGLGAAPAVSEAAHQVGQDRGQLGALGRAGGGAGRGRSVHGLLVALVY